MDCIEFTTRAPKICGKILDQGPKSILIKKIDGKIETIDKAKMKSVKYGVADLTQEELEYKLESIEKEFNNKKIGNQSTKTKVKMRDGKEFIGTITSIDTKSGKFTFRTDDNTTFEINDIADIAGMEIEPTKTPKPETAEAKPPNPKEKFVPPATPTPLKMSDSEILRRSVFTSAQDDPTAKLLVMFLKYMPLFVVAQLHNAKEHTIYSLGPNIANTQNPADGIQTQKYKCSIGEILCITSDRPGIQISDHENSKNLNKNVADFNKKLIMFSLLVGITDGVSVKFGWSQSKNTENTGEHINRSNSINAQVPNESQFNIQIEWKLQ